jgi:hypothetical protein
VDELEVSGLQGPSLPKNGPKHSLIGQHVLVTHGQYKGYDAHVKDVGHDFVLIEIDGMIVSGARIQPMKWGDFKAVYVLFLLSSRERLC